MPPAKPKPTMPDPLPVDPPSDDTPVVPVPPPQPVDPPSPDKPA